MDSEKQIKITDTLLVAFISAAAYIITFSYEAGFSTYFNIPFSLISLSITTILKVAAVLTLASLQFYPLLDFLFGLMPRRTTYIRQRIVLYIVSMSFFIICFIPLLKYGEGFRYLLAILILLFLYCFSGLFRTRSLLKYEQHLKEKVLSDEAEKETKPSDIFYQKVLHGQGKFITRSLLALGLICFLANIMGMKEAEHQKNFYVTDNRVLLRQYDDLYITQAFDQKTKQLVSKIFIRKLGENAEVGYTFTNVGELKPAKTEVPITSQSKIVKVKPTVTQLVVPKQTKAETNPSST